MSTNPEMNQSTKSEFLYILVFLDLNADGQAPSTEAKVDLDDETFTGTNNK